jgi:hypothetical protein
MALGGEAFDQVVDFRLGADIDAASRLVEQEDLGSGRQPAGDDRLLLVAAAEKSGSAGRAGTARLTRFSSSRRALELPC